jgi:hypothetical protein
LAIQTPGGKPLEEIPAAVGDLARWISLKDPGRLKVGHLLEATKANDTSEWQPSQICIAPKLLILTRLVFVANRSFFAKSWVCRGAINC